MSFNVIYVPALPLLSELMGNDYVVGYSPALGKNVRISINTLRQGVGVPLWDPGTVYNEDFIVEWQLKFWKSLVDDNENIFPTEGASWTEVSSATTGAVNSTYRGDYDPEAAGVNGYPEAGGSGLEGSIEGGNEWVIPAGLDDPVVINGEAQDPGTILKALYSNPGQDHTKWRLI